MVRGIRVENCELPYCVLRTSYGDWHSYPMNALTHPLGTPASRIAYPTGHSWGSYANRDTKYAVRSTAVALTDSGAPLHPHHFRHPPDAIARHALAVRLEHQPPRRVRWRAHDQVMSAAHVLVRLRRHPAAIERSHAR